MKSDAINGGKAQAGLQTQDAKEPVAVVSLSFNQPVPSSDTSGPVHRLSQPLTPNV